MLGIYVHIPFCVKKCPYCDFVSFEDKNPEDYICALKKEIEFYGKEEGQIIDTIFFGGGTPTSIDAGYIADIMVALREFFDISENCEITIEANPGTVDRASLCEYISCGVNRISFGLQSADDDELKTLGRIHSFADFKNSYNLAKGAGFDNINIDLMFGLPNQTKEAFVKSLDMVSSFDPKHISCYSLKLEENTPYYKRYYDSDKFADEDVERDMYHYASKKLKENGYIHYETSNFSKEGGECKHNLKYWTGESYIGFGVSAHSYVAKDKGSYRYSNTDDFDKYIESVEKGIMPINDKTQLSEKDMIDEYIMLHLRLNTGISFSDFNKKFKMDFSKVYKKQIEKLNKNKMITVDSEGIYPTLFGFDLQNTMITMFL